VETGSVPMPPAGKLFGFNEEVWGVAPRLDPRHFLELSRTVGGNMIRTNLDWRHAEPRQNVWDESWWSRWRRLYDAARGRGMTVVFIIGSAPTWARAAVHQGCNRFGPCEFPPAPEMDDEWAEYAAEVARRFPDALIEVWNEPNLRFFWDSGADPERWAELQASAFDAINAVSPETEVIAGGLSNNQTTEDGHMALREFLDRAYDADPSIEDHMDYVGVHPYPYSESFGANTLFAKSLEDVRSVREAYRDDTPLFVTEVGISTGDPEALGEEARADASIRLYRRLMTMDDVAGVAFHRLVAPAGANSWTSGSAWTVNGASPTTPKPVYCRFVAEARRSYPLCSDPHPLDTDLAGKRAAVVSAGSVEIEFESPNYDAAYQCSLDGAPFSLCWSPWRVDGLTDGEHSFEVRAVTGVDGTIEATPARYVFRVGRTTPDPVDDSSPPAIPTRPPTPTPPPDLSIDVPPRRDTGRSSRSRQARGDGAGRDRRSGHARGRGRASRDRAPRGRRPGGKRNRGTR
jgi:Cellulase (glycosyl hydrolase family 5)